MKKRMAMMATFVFSLFVFAGVASAHVVVFPQKTTQGTYEKFTVRVPTEKDSPTVKVKLDVPKEVEVFGVEPMPGWKYELAKDQTGLITGITWTAENKGLRASEFGEFNIQGKVSDKADKIVWKAYQTYKDGSVVKWTGAEDSENPASVTQVAKSNGNAHDHHASHAGANEESAQTNHEEAKPSNIPLYLSIAAVILSLVAVIISLLKARKQ